MPMLLMFLGQCFRLACTVRHSFCTQSYMRYDSHTISLVILIAIKTMVAIRISAAAVLAIVVGGSRGADFVAEDVDERACVPEEADADCDYAGEDVAFLYQPYANRYSK